MRGAAAMASQSGPKVRKRWDGPPLERRNPRTLPDVQGLNFKCGSNETEDSLSTRFLQAAFGLDRHTDNLLASGRNAAAERLAHLAAELRECRS